MPPCRRAGGVTRCRLASPGCGGRYGGSWRDWSQPWCPCMGGWICACSATRRRSCRRAKPYASRRPSRRRPTGACRHAAAEGRRLAPAFRPAARPGPGRRLSRRSGTDRPARRSGCLHPNTDALFASGSARRVPADLPLLGRIRDALRDVPGRSSIVGHTDDRRPAPGAPSNWALSLRRAPQVVELLRRETDSLSGSWRKARAAASPSSPTTRRRARPVIGAW